MKPYIEATLIPTLHVLLDGLLIKKRRGEVLTTFEWRIAVDLIEALPFDEGLNLCGVCAARDISRSVLSGRSVCREHALEELGKNPVAAPQGVDRPLTPRTQEATRDTEVQFIDTLLARKRMGKPPSVGDWSRAHLAVDALDFSRENLCSECEAENVYWPACTGFTLCAHHLNAVIDTPPVMT